MLQKTESTAIAWLRRVRASEVVQSRSVLSLIVALWAFGWLPNVANMLTRGRVQFSFDTSYAQDTVLAAWTILAIYAVVAAALVVAIWCGTSRPRRCRVGGLALAAAPAVYEIAVANPVNGVWPTQPQVFIYLAVVFALWLSGPRHAYLACIAILATLTATVSLVGGFWGWGVLDESTGVATEKALLFPNLLAGIYSYNNSLGMVLALSLPTILLLRSRVAVVVGFTTVLAALVWSGSRTSMIAVLITVLATAAVMLTRGRVRTLLAGTVLAGLGAVTVALPFVYRDDPGAFSARGRLWDVALELWSRSPWLGLGRSAFEPDSELSRRIDLVVAHGHNFFVTVGLVGGILGVALTVALAVAVSISAVRTLSTSVIPFALVCSTLALGLMETPGNFFPFERPNTTTYIVWLVFAFAFWRSDEAHWGRAVVRGRLDGRGFERVGAA